MDPLTAMAAASVAANAFSAYSGSKAQESANEQNQQMSREQMRFQSDMSNTAHQREVYDLRAAGLNPLLSASKGATTPGGSSVMSAPVKNPVGEALLGSVNSAASAASLSKDLQQKDASIALTSAQKTASDKQAQLSQSTAQKIDAQLANDPSLDPTVSRDLKTSLKAKAKADMHRSEVDLLNAATDKEFQSYDAINRRVQSGLGSAASALDLVNPLNKWFPKSPRGYTEENYNPQGEHIGTKSRRYQKR